MVENSSLMADMEWVWEHLLEDLEGSYDDSAVTEGGYLRILKHHVSDLDGSLVMDLRVSDAGNAEDTYPWLCQIFTTVAESVDLDSADKLSAKLEEISFYFPFGNFGVYREGQQVYHNYTFAAQDAEDDLVSQFAFYIERILDQLTQLYPLVLLLTTSPEDVDVEAIFSDEG